MYTSAVLASIAGTAEPIYGPDALHAVSVQEDQNPKYEFDSEDVQWLAPESTCAETETFYIEAESGHFVMIQVIYSNVVNLHISAQCNVKVFYPDGSIHWSAKTMENFRFDEQKRCFEADGFSIVLHDDNCYRIISRLDPETVVDLKISRTIPGFKVGKDGKTNFGSDPRNPWGCIRHLFWPKGCAEGKLEVKGNKLMVSGNAVFIMALQAMKPHHAASKWNFITFQSEKLNAIMMEFTTPPSYGSQTVNVGGVFKDDALVLGTTAGTFQHTESALDPDTQWVEPTSIKVLWKGTSQDGKDTEASLEVKLGSRIDRVDIMAEVPAIIKRVIAGAVGTRPYIYQYRQKATLKLRIGDQVSSEEGQIFTEATFINA
ncbi:oxidative stress survival, Svf1-like protein [Trichophaea hybrida]|nr:oxidative stress survival, Svf1-like protein [Trichophaea hybrida]